MIVGVLHLQSKIKYGYNKRNTPIYLFTPYDRELETCKVASSEEDKTHNQIAVVDTRSENGPFIVRLLGKVGDSKTEGLAMYLHYSPYAVYNARTVERLMKSVEPLEPVKRVDISHLPTINIDSEETKDIDDVISFDLPNVYITIADVASYLQPNSEIDFHAKNVGQSLYYPELPPHTMFPPQFESIATLSVGSLRNGITLKYNIKTKTSKFMLTTVINKEKYTYESIYGSRYASILCNLTKEFGTVTNDSHKWIEACMVHYNCEAAKLFIEHKTGMFRKQDLPIGLHPDLSIMHSAAIYTTEPHIHSGFGKVYCHATSPLRRYVDLINQRILHSILENKEIIAVPCPDEFNVLQKQSKRFSRDAFFLSLVLLNQSGTVDAVVTDVDEDYIQFYVPSWKRILKKKKAENVEIGYSISVDYLIQPHNVFWKDRVLFRISNINYPE